jgi:hypothetical protein
MLLDSGSFDLFRSASILFAPLATSRLTLRRIGARPARGAFNSPGMRRGRPWTVEA